MMECGMLGGCGLGVGRSVCCGKLCLLSSINMILSVSAAS